MIFRVMTTAELVGLCGYLRDRGYTVAIVSVGDHWVVRGTLRPCLVFPRLLDVRCQTPQYGHR